LLIEAVLAGSAVENQDSQEEIDSSIELWSKDVEKWGGRVRRAEYNVPERKFRGVFQSILNLFIFRY
jgi:hypothetical protein